MNLLERFTLLRQTGSKSLAVLIDPDQQVTLKHLEKIIGHAGPNGIGMFLIGGSTTGRVAVEHVLHMLRDLTALPLILFPGHPAQICEDADAVLFLSMISGRNPDLLIGHHTAAAPLLKKSGMEVLPTGYLLVGSDRQTTVARVSGTDPIPNEKRAFAADTALAGEMLGMKLIYLEAGSGAREPIHHETIQTVRDAISVPLLAGGGIRSAEAAKKAWACGADILVVGNALETNPALIRELTSVLRDEYEPISMRIDPIS